MSLCLLYLTSDNIVADAANAVISEHGNRDIVTECREAMGLGIQGIQYFSVSPSLPFNPATGACGALYASSPGGPGGARSPNAFSCISR